MPNSNPLTEILLPWLGQVWYGLFLVVLLLFLPLGNAKLKIALISIILAALAVPLLHSPVSLTFYLLGWLLVIIVLAAGKKNQAASRHIATDHVQRSSSGNKSLLQRFIGETVFCFTNTIIFWSSEIKALWREIKRYQQKKNKKR